MQVASPNLFPDLTHWQAEPDQAKVNAGQEPWKLDAAKTAVQFANSLLKWSPEAQATLLSGGGAQDPGASDGRVHGFWTRDGSAAWAAILGIITASSIALLWLLWPR